MRKYITSKSIFAAIVSVILYNSLFRLPVYALSIIPEENLKLGVVGSFYLPIIILSCIVVIIGLIIASIYYPFVKKQKIDIKILIFYVCFLLLNFLLRFILLSIDGNGDFRDDNKLFINIICFFIPTLFIGSFGIYIKNFFSSKNKIWKNKLIFIHGALVILLSIFVEIWLLCL